MVQDKTFVEQFDEDRLKILDDLKQGINNVVQDLAALVLQKANQNLESGFKFKITDRGALKQSGHIKETTTDNTVLFSLFFAIK